MSTANSSLALEEVNEHDEVPVLNLLVKARHPAHKVQEEDPSVDYVITGSITVSF